MKQELDSAIRGYMYSGGISKLLGIGFKILGFVIAGQLLSQFANRFLLVKQSSPIIRDPFTVLAVAVFLLSRADFDFMQFRLESAGIKTFSRDPLLAQLEVPKSYRESFGVDIFVRAWNYRLAFVALFGIAALRWIW